MLTEARICLAFTLIVAMTGTTIVFGVAAAMVGASWLLTIPWAVRVNQLTFAARDTCRAPHCWSEYGTPCATCPKEKL